MHLKFKDSSNQKNKKITLSVSFNYRSKKISWQMNIMKRILIHNPTTHGHQLISCKYSFLNLIYICYVRTWIENILFRLKRRKVFSLFTLKKNVPLSFFDSFELFPRIFSLFIYQRYFFKKQIFDFSFNISSCYNNIARGPTVYKHK